jgi:antagonist of KipI
MSLQVLEPGLSTLVVDGGRPQYRSLGVPVGGAADRAALALGNALVGNEPDAAALEITLAGPSLRAECSLAGVVYGAPFELTRNGEELSPARTFSLEPGDVLQIRGTRVGLRAYLCVPGGFGTEVILESRSGLEPLQRGAVLPCVPSALSSRQFKPEKKWDPNVTLQRVFGLPPSTALLRVLPGPQFDWFSAGDLLTRTFEFNWPGLEVTAASNRMGLRLSGEPLQVPARELISEPVCPGSVQVTREGQCIILGVDGQTIGGYPKLAQVIAADLDALGQLRPGDHVQFIRVELEVAEELARRKRAELNALITRLRTAAKGAAGHWRQSH